MFRRFIFSLSLLLIMSCAHHSRSPSGMNSWEERGIKINQMERLRDF